MSKQVKLRPQKEERALIGLNTVFHRYTLNVLNLTFRFNIADSIRTTWSTIINDALTKEYTHNVYNIFNHPYSALYCCFFPDKTATLINLSISVSFSVKTTTLINLSISVQVNVIIDDCEQNLLAIHNVPQFIFLGQVMQILTRGFMSSLYRLLIPVQDHKNISASKLMKISSIESILSTSILSAVQGKHAKIKIQKRLKQQYAKCIDFAMNYCITQCTCSQIYLHV